MSHCERVNQYVFGVARGEEGSDRGNILTDNSHKFLKTNKYFKKHNTS